jgi:hypothetical protein
VATVIVAVLLVLPGQAQRQSRTKVQPSPKPPAVAAYVDGTFDPSVSELPQGFEGDSIQRLYDRLNAVKAPKGEFETSDQYQQRINRKDTGRYAFVLNNAFAGPTMKYDADKGEYEIQILEDFGAIVDYNRVGAARAISIVKTSVNGSYKATNRFGAVTTVNTMSTDAYAISLQNRSGGGPGEERVRRFRLPVSIAEAPAMKDQLGVLFVCELFTGPGFQTFSGSASISGTFWDPSELRESYSYVRVNLLSVWLFDRRTRRVLMKVDDYK